MSLLLAVFVMIAAMSELRAGGRFEETACSVRSAFGFSSPDRASSLDGLLLGARPTLLDRLEQAGLGGSAGARLGRGGDEVLADCEMMVHPDRIILRVSGEVAFEPFASVPTARAERAIARLAEYLADGRTHLEIRGHSATDRLPGDVPFRDAWDLAYERARGVARALVRAGVSRDRLHVSAWGDHDPLVPPTSDSAAAGSAPGRESPAANRRIEIIVHAVPAASHVNRIAEKERVNDG
jgi:outer membrane protein OmpA-like peptidoglycan-associated protein